ncbi:MAG TPA: hypothetical protein VE200_08445, partial [Xanthobacteraceae bacterium]|nr:hypothetical protein [Xanthobacteraceae bacterium]
ATEAAGHAPDHEQKRAALGYLNEAWLEARIDGIDGDCLAQACLFALKLIGSGLAGVLVATALWQEGWKPAPSPQNATGETAAHSSAGETTVYRRQPATDDVDRGSETGTTDVADRAPPSNYPLRVRTMTFTPPAQDATGSIAPKGRSRPGGS